MPLNPAPTVRQVLTRPTPKVTDLLFYDLKDSRIPTNTNPPAYGTPHPDRTKYRDHKLVFVETADESGWMRWWYAADREAQDEYNFAVSYPYAGDEAFPRYTRTYIIPREDYAPLVTGSADPVVDDAVLVAQTMKPIDGQLGSLYVEVTRVYDVIPGTDDTEGTGASQSGGGYVVERPLGTLGFLKLTWTITLPTAIAESSTADGRADYVACPITGYTDLTLVDETISSDSEQDSSRTVRRIYLKQQTDQKVDKFRLTRNLEPPERFTSYIERQRKEQVVTAQTADNPDSWTGSGAFSSIQSAVTMETMLVGSKQVEEVRYSTTPLVEQAWDPNLGVLVETSRFAVLNSVLAAWLADTSNIVPATDFYETAPLNASWTVVSRTRMPVGSLLDAEASNPTKTGHVLDYFTARPFSWPRVLTNLSDESYTLKDRDGNVAQTVTSWVPEYKEAWSGICRARVFRWWQKTVLADTVQPIQTLIPTAIEVDWPVGSVSILPCLHAAVTFEGTTGTDNPLYGNAVFERDFAATSLTSRAGNTTAADWPSKLIAAFEVEPYRNGYLFTRVDVYKPY